MFRNSTDICTLTSYLAAFLNSFVILMVLLWKENLFYIEDRISSNFTYFSVQMSFVFYSCLIVWLEFPILCWKEMVKALALFLILERSLSLLPLSMKFAVGFSYIAFIMLRQFPSIFSLLSLFYHEKMVKFFLVKWVFSLMLVWCITLIDFYILNCPCISGINLTWSWYIILLICYWILFASVVCCVSLVVLFWGFVCLFVFWWLVLF